MYLNNNMVMCAGSSEKSNFKALGTRAPISTKFRAAGDEDQRILLGCSWIRFTLGVTSGFALKKAARTILFTVRSSFKFDRHKKQNIRASVLRMLTINAKSRLIEVKYKNIQDIWKAC